MLFFPVGKDAMNAPRYWELHDACSDVNTSANAPRFSYPNEFLSQWIFMAALGIRILIANSSTRWHWIKGDGEAGKILVENLWVSQSFKDNFYADPSGLHVALKDTLY